MEDGSPTRWRNRSDAVSGHDLGVQGNYQRVEFPGPLDLANREVDVTIITQRAAKLVGAMQAAPSL